ncbi:MAG: helix-turn-helix domain-containing protein [Sphingobacteriales bacterium]|nr:helix-turn-helix domain-containing protein [Sphingobacteriales bacterium]OJW02006.1 MAG: hypothetical protein BGO52_00555 [Sphingobacteriales bacterium 44-61]
MAVELATREDLENLRKQIIEGVKAIILELLKTDKDQPLEGLKTRQVRKILGCSTNTLKAHRISRKIRVKKVGGTLYYNREDVRKLVEEGF